MAGALDVRRRRLLLASAGLLGLALPGAAFARKIATPKFTADPFALGVASGEPDDSGFVLWTRLAPDPLNAVPRYASAASAGSAGAGGGGLSAASVPVRWEVADDERFARIVARGTALAEEAWAHSLHVEVAGLAADRWYFYRFHCGAATSPVGRARTLPAAGAKLAQLRVGVASCQNYEDGYYAAWRHLSTEAPDLVLHLGDYIYEFSLKDPLRRHAGGTCRTLADYRTRHAQYRTDPDLRAAHAACPWFAVWDDHDVENDYAADQSQDFDDPEAFLLRRAAAYQAYWEHLPLRASARPRGAFAQMYRRAQIGDLATIHLLDSRQYRDDQACPTPNAGGARLLVDDECPARTEPQRTMLGAAQEAWLGQGLSDSKARWNVIAQQLLMGGLDQKPGPHAGWWSDAWDGYPAARERLLRAASAPGVSDSIVLGGDIHSFWATDLKLAGRTVASEFTGTSISSRGVPQDAFARMLPDNPHVRFFDARWRGYMRCLIGRDAWRTDFVAVDDVKRADSPARVLQSFIVERGHPGPQLA